MKPDDIINDGDVVTVMNSELRDDFEAVLIAWPATALLDLAILRRCDTGELYNINLGSSDFYGLRKKAAKDGDE